VTVTPGIGQSSIIAPTTPPTTLLGSFVGYTGTTRINTGAGVDTFDVRRLQGPTSIFAGAGADVINLGTQAGLNNNLLGVLNEIVAELTVNGEAGVDVINIDDDNDSADNGRALTHEYLTTAASLLTIPGATTKGFFGTGGRLHYLTSETLNFFLGTGSDTLLVGSSADQLNPALNSTLNGFP